MTHKKGNDREPYIGIPKKGMIGSLGIPRDSTMGMIGALGIPRDSKKGMIGSLGIPRDKRNARKPGIPRHAKRG